MTTVTASEPAAAMSAAGMAAVICVAETKAVVRLLPLTLATAPLTKPVPLIVRVKSAAPAMTRSGLSRVKTGPPAMTVSGRAVEVPPPGVGVLTVTSKVAAAVMSAALMVAVNWVGLT